jgi:hypothetical protein
MIYPVQNLNVKTGGKMSEKCQQSFAPQDDHRQGCQIFHGTKYQNWKEYRAWPKNIPTFHEIYQMPKKLPNVIKFTKFFRSVALKNLPKM